MRPTNGLAGFHVETGEALAGSFPAYKCTMAEALRMSKGLGVRQVEIKAVLTVLVAQEAANAVRGHPRMGLRIPWRRKGRGRHAGASV